jgi:hypothetical protein
VKKRLSLWIITDLDYQPIEIKLGIFTNSVNL